jgi:hypothetical protein
MHRLPPSIHLPSWWREIIPIENLPRSSLDETDGNAEQNILSLGPVAGEDGRVSFRRTIRPSSAIAKDQSRFARGADRAERSFLASDEMSAAGPLR